MRILLACEFYAPSVGGVQEVMRQVAERLVLRGHEVTVATTHQSDRRYTELNGVIIRGFEVAGNLARGLTGEVNEYREFVLDGHFDAILVKAAQQWTFDALWPILDQIEARKVFIPCGFSGLFDPGYEPYFAQMSEILAKFDRLIFYSDTYRDIAFARKAGLENVAILPNGASEQEFSVPVDPGFRTRYGIGPDDFLCLTIGSYTGRKGHLEVLQAFEAADFSGRATLILNGNTIHYAATGWASRVKGFIRTHLLPSAGARHQRQCQAIAARVNRLGTKRVMMTNMPRPELVQALMAADLFLFASHIEYSPLVLFEAAAAGTPFLTVPVGNAAEIAEWTGAGEICPAAISADGYTKVEVPTLARQLAVMANDRDHLRQLGATGKTRWLERFTWAKIVEEYERVLVGEAVSSPRSEPSP